MDRSETSETLMKLVVFSDTGEKWRRYQVPLHVKEFDAIKDIIEEFRRNKPLLKLAVFSDLSETRKVYETTITDEEYCILKKIIDAVHEVRRYFTSRR